MANKKITELTAASSVDDADTIPIVQGGVTKRATAGLLRSSVNTTNGSAPQAAAQVDTTDATQTAIGDAVTLATDSITTIDVAVQCIQAGASKAKVFSVRRSFLNDGGTVTDGTQTDLLTAEELGGSLAASVAITRTGTTVQPKVTGVAGTALRWYLISQAQKVTAATGSVPSAPTAISPSSGSTAGGTAVTITVPDSTGLTGAKVGGVALTGFAIDDATHVSGTTGAHAAGAVDVVVSNAYGDSAALAGGFTYSAVVFDPATLPLSLWLRTDYTASPWTSTASAGASGARTASEATNPPAVGAAVNGHNPADFDGTNDKLSTTVLESDLFTAAAGSLAILYYADTTDAANGTPTDDEAMFAGAGGYVMATVNNTGARVVLYDTGNKSIQLAGGTAGAWHLLQAKWDGTNLKARLDSGAWTTLACGNMGDLTSALNIGCNHNATAFFDGRLAEVITAASTLSDADFDNLVSYCNSRYGLAL